MNECARKPKNNEMTVSLTPGIQAPTAPDAGAGASAGHGHGNIVHGYALSAYGGADFRTPRSCIEVMKSKAHGEWMKAEKVEIVRVHSFPDYATCATQSQDSHSP